MAGSDEETGDNLNKPIDPDADTRESINLGTLSRFRLFESREDRNMTFAFIDSFPHSFAVVDLQGVLLTTNNKWQKFGARQKLNNVIGCQNGENYLQVWDKATGIGEEYRKKAGDAILKVLEGDSDMEILEYPYGGVGGIHWLRMGVYTFKVRRQDGTKSSQGAAIFHRDVTQRRIEMEAWRGVFDNNIKLITRIVNSVDPYTAGHQEQVAELAYQMARKLGLTERECYAIRVAGEVHDSGKAREELFDILRAQRRLTSEEYEKIKMHPVWGYELLEGIGSGIPIREEGEEMIDLEKQIRLITRHHHENIDGTGYPDGKTGDELDVGSRIVAVADRWDARGSHRSYRKAMPFAKNKHILVDEEKGKLLQPEFVDVCLAVVEEIPELGARYGRLS